MDTQSSAFLSVQPEMGHNETDIINYPFNNSTFGSTLPTVSSEINLLNLSDLDRRAICCPELFPGENPNMTDTILNITCQANVSCSQLLTQPGANILCPIILSLTGVTGQIWALILLYRSTRPQHARTVFFVMLSTLIWTDLVGKLLTTPPAIIAYVNDHWVGGKEMCNFHGFTMMTIGLVTHCLVSVMAIERFLGIRKSIYYNKNITRSRAKLLLVSIWLFVVLFCALPLFGIGQYSLQYPNSWCFINLHVNASTPWHHAAYTDIYGILNIACLVIIVSCNFIVIGTLIKTRFYRDSAYCHPHRSSKQRELELQMVTLLVVITIVFVVSWSPLDFRLFLNQIWQHKTRESHEVDLQAVRLVSLNQIIDPWAYIISRKVFNSDVWKTCRVHLFGRGWSHRRESSSIQRWISPKRISQTLFNMRGQNGKCAPVSDNVDLTFEKNKNQGIVHMHDELIKESETSMAPVNPPISVMSTSSSNKKLLRASEDEKNHENHVEICRDSGTESIRTASLHSNEESHPVFTDSCHTTSGTDRPNKTDAPGVYLVPIPVFTSEKYHLGMRTCVMDSSIAAATFRETRRLQSTQSARSASSGTRRHPQQLPLISTSSKDECNIPTVVERRHSWTYGFVDSKYFCSQSTQTVNHFSPSTTNCSARTHIILHDVS